MGQYSNGDLDVSKVIRLSIKSCLDPAGSQLEGFKNVCYEVRNLEELFLIVNCRKKWVRAVIGLESLDPEMPWPVKGDPSYVPSRCSIESNIGLYVPYWSDCQGRAITSLHIPSQMRQEVFVEEIAIVEKLWTWMKAGTDWKIRHGSMSYLEKQDADADVKHVGEIARGVSKVSWRKRTFVLKDTDFDNEFDYVKRLSPHPNVVPGFGVLCKRSKEHDGGLQNAYLMEFIPGGDLLSLIVEKTRLNGNLPPFPSHDALDILWQFANAVKHMHQQHVVHCDLKSKNVLISTSGTTAGYLVKVADFGSARECETDPSFRAGDGTTCYAAPEYLKQRGGRHFDINQPDKIDVYSFGVVAYELLTGENCEANHLHKYGQGEGKLPISEFTTGVKDGTLRSPLREKCKAHIKRSQGWRFSNFWRRERQSFESYWPLQQEDLISLIERCWHHDPAERPPFEEIWRDLGRLKLRFLGEWESR